MNAYQEFHRLKNELINRLTSIEDGSCMGDWCNDLTTNIPVKEQVTKISKLAKKLEKHSEELAEIEKEY
ncbi:hypothetical protein [Enterococcus sp. N249-2]